MFTPAATKRRSKLKFTVETFTPDSSTSSSMFPKSAFKYVGISWVWTPAFKQIKAASNSENLIPNVRHWSAFFNYSSFIPNEMHDRANINSDLWIPILRQLKALRSSVTFTPILRHSTACLTSSLLSGPFIKASKHALKSEPFTPTEIKSRLYDKREGPTPPFISLNKTCTSSGLSFKALKQCNRSLGSTPASNNCINSF